jgi:hypothetical protein
MPIKQYSFNHGYEAIKINLLEYDHNLAERNFLALRQTWKETMDHPYDPADPLCIKFIKDLMNHKLFGTFIKSGTIMYQIKNISRVCLAQITRDQGWTWCSESNMPNPLSHNITIPRFIYDNPRWKSWLEEIQIQICDLYKEMCEAGVPYQDSRYIGLHGQTISITGQVNVEKFQAFCASRLNNNTHDEINMVYRQMKHELRKAIVEDHKNGSLDDLSYYMWDKIEKAADVGEARTKKTTFFDPLFCNSFARYPSAAPEPRPMFDANKLSWKYELIEMYQNHPELLLPGESAMIECWGKPYHIQSNPLPFGKNNVSGDFNDGGDNADKA